MKKIFTYMTIVTVMLASFCLTAGKPGSNEASMYMYDHVFTHDTPASGTYTAKIAGTGVFAPFTDSYGSFVAYPISRSEAILISESYSDVCGVQVKTVATGLANLFDGTYVAWDVELTILNTRKGNEATTTDVTSSGYVDPFDFDTLVLDLTATFADDFKANQYKACNSNKGKNNGFGNGDQDAPGKSGGKNNAENAE
jgi:hypothetical protein